jgi:hypothetical protein
MPTPGIARILRADAFLRRGGTQAADAAQRGQRAHARGAPQHAAAAERKTRQMIVFDLHDKASLTS